MATQTKEGKARNKQLLTSYKRYQASLDDKLNEVQDTIAAALKDGGVTESTMESLASIFRGYEFIKPIADEAWERYNDHCETFEYDLQD
jgi:hypothetical protein